MKEKEKPDQTPKHTVRQLTDGRLYSHTRQPNKRFCVLHTTKGLSV